MVGVVVVAHGRLGEELIKTCELITGRFKQARSVSLDTSMSPESLRTLIEEAAKAVDDGDGVLILVDLFGGTPSNISLSFLSPGKIEVVSGINLPMLLKLSQRTDEESLSNIAEQVAKAGRRGICLASEILSK